MTHTSVLFLQNNHANSVPEHPSAETAYIATSRKAKCISWWPSSRWLVSMLTIYYFIKLSFKPMFLQQTISHARINLQKNSETAYSPCQRSLHCHPGLAAPFLQAEYWVEQWRTPVTCDQIHQTGQWVNMMQVNQKTKITCLIHCSSATHTIETTISVVINLFNYK